MSQRLENVIKQGYLKKGNTGGNRLSGLLKKIEGQKWFVFTIREGIPYLEYFDNETEVFSQRPINSYSLYRCRSVTSMGRTNPPTFSISCSDRFIELVASSRGQMLEWVHDIDNALTRLGILKKDSDDHVYTVLPAVVRQPRVSKEVLEEREAMTPPAFHPEPSRSHSASNLPPDPSHVTDDVEPPPLPNRPPPLVPRNSIRNQPIASTEISTSEMAQKAPEELSASKVMMNELESSPSQINCSNDSDFVSWDVVMQVRENYLRKSGESRGLATGGFDSDGERLDDEEIFTTNSKLQQKSKEETDTHSSVFDESDQSLFQFPNTSLLMSEDALDLSTLPSNVSSFPSVGSESDLSVSMEHISKKAEMEENQYSLLPGRLKDEDPEKIEIEKEVQYAAKPIPLPRRALSMKTDTFESNFLQHRKKDENDHSEASDHILVVSMGKDDEERRNPPGAGSNILLDLLVDFDSNDEFHQEGGAKSSGNKDENENFYDIENSKSHSVLAPPSIPPRCDSLLPSLIPTSLSRPNEVNATCDSNFYSHPISSSCVRSLANSSSLSSEVMFIPSLELSSNKENSAKPDATQPPAIPPLPLPRRKTTQPVKSAFNSRDGSLDAAMEIPKLPPRRFLPKSASLPEDIPPALPSRNFSACSMTKPLLSASSSIADYDEKSLLKEDEEEQNWGAACSATGGKSATLGVTSASRQSGLAKKMLLDRANSLHTVVSLKQTQAEILQLEIEKTHVNVTLTQKSGHGLALVDWNGMSCVAGWNQKDFPSLHGKLHIGDLIISVNHVRVTSSSEAQKLLKHAQDSKIEVMLQRMPYAKVFAVRRSAEGQSLGLKREGGTAEILYVDPNGLAAQHGLPQYAQGTMGKSRCTWFLTEINSRPLNLFFKENEIEHRLYAVGREISIVVQPSDFIFEIRHRLKKVKNYKNYITQ